MAGKILPESGHTVQETFPHMQTLKHLSLSVFVAIVIFCGGLSASAQSDSASVAGRITDASGAVVPNAQVDLVSVGRGTVTHTKSNGSGIYVLPSVAPGLYNISVSHAGFRQVDLTKLIVNVQANIEQNFKLQWGLFRKASPWKLPA